MITYGSDCAIWNQCGHRNKSTVEVLNCIKNFQANNSSFVREETIHSPSSWKLMTCDASIIGFAANAINCNNN